MGCFDSKITPVGQAAPSAKSQDRLDYELGREAFIKDRLEKHAAECGCSVDMKLTFEEAYDSIKRNLREEEDFVPAEKKVEPTDEPFPGSGEADLEEEDEEDEEDEDEDEDDEDIEEDEDPSTDGTALPSSIAAEPEVRREQSVSLGQTASTLAAMLGLPAGAIGSPIDVHDEQIIEVTNPRQTKSLDDPTLVIDTLEKLLSAIRGTLEALVGNPMIGLFGISEQITASMSALFLLSQTLIHRPSPLTQYNDRVDREEADRRRVAAAAVIESTDYAHVFLVDEEDIPEDQLDFYRQQREVLSALPAGAIARARAVLGVMLNEDHLEHAYGEHLSEIVLPVTD